MSELSLIPNPQVMVVQAVVFLSQVYVVNKYLVVPFAKLKKLRTNATLGADSKSNEITSEIEKLSTHIKSSLSKASEEIKKVKETELIAAKKTRETSVAQAQKEMTELVNTARKEIFTNLQEEKKKLDPLVNKLADEVYARLAG